MEEICVNFYDDNRYFGRFKCQISDTIQTFLTKALSSLDIKMNSKEKHVDLLPSVYLRGHILPSNEKLEKYIDDLHYYALFISNDPTKELPINPIHTNLNDYQCQKEISGEKFLFKAINKQTNQKVLIQFKSIITENWENDVCGLYVSQLISTEGFPKLIGYNFSVNMETLRNFNSSIHIEFCNFYIYEDNFTDFDLDKMHKYNKSQGKDDSNINPTMRSKLIFGVASIMKKIHQKKVCFLRLNNSSIKLDKNYEPKIFDFSKSKFAINKRTWQDVTIESPLYCSPEFIACDNSDYPEMGVDVYSFAIFIYTLFLKDMNFKFSDGKEIKPSHSNMALFQRIVDGLRFERLENIPDHYWELIVFCWDQDPNNRPSFDEIVNILKDDRFALTEFGVKTNLDELHEYQKRIESS